MRQTSLISACFMHSSMHALHIAMHASSIADMDAMSMPIGRIMARIIVLHMSAQFMHMVAHDIIMPSSMPCPEHTVHACSHAEQASMHACMTAMSMLSMPAIGIMPLDIMPIIIASTPHLAPRRPSRAGAPACGHATTPVAAPTGPVGRLEGMSSRIHNPATRILRTTAAGLATAALALAALLVTAAPASAHDQLVGTDPAAGSTVDAVPAQITLTFNEKVLPDAGATAIVVTSAGGTPVQEGDPVVSDTTVTQAIVTPADPDGTYTVEWKVVSSDGHPVSGDFSFTVSGASPSPTPTPTPTPTQTAIAPTPTPTSTPAPPADGGGVPAWAWAIVAVVVVAVLGGILYLIVSRARRKAEDERLRAGGSTPQDD
jgi:methionine-rich copper-binding protein CopC